MRTIEIHQKNMYCNVCLLNVVKAVSSLEGLHQVGIDMSSKTIYLKLADATVGRKKIQALIHTALTTGEINQPM